MPIYDEHAALEILAEYGERTDPSASSAERIEAARRLLDELHALDGRTAGLSIVRDRDRLRIGFDLAEVSVVQQDGKILVVGASGAQEVPLVFNRVAARLEGADFDEDWTPDPGGPRRRRRDALAVLANAVVVALDASQ